VSGFSPEWLRLREPADHRARDRGLARRLAAHLEARESIRLVDLGCGTGSNFRALSPALPPRQHWRLVDHDPALLNAAREEIAKWPDGSRDISFEAADLSHDLEQALAPDCDVVTAAALFDLVSEAWLARLVAVLAKRPHAFYTVLIYDGVMEWDPVHPADEPVRAAFNVHQHADKGFGQAAGPDAGAFLVRALERAGFDVRTAPSPWVLTREDLPLILSAAEGIADAARQTGLVAEADITDWLQSRVALTGCTIGHLDILALP
jgi:SAM-dependent methyltransferase